MTIHLYNTLTRDKQEFTPLDADNVRIYVCGPTVYDFAHIGNARPVVVFDVLNRLLRHVYGAEHVTYVRNITDVDDKIINRAKETGEDISAITSKTEKAFHVDMEALGDQGPDIEPRATEHIPEMITMIEKLLKSGNAYEADGHVLFSVSSCDSYGELSGRNRDEMIAGARVEVAPYKKDPADFVLWKPSTDDQPGWESPFGEKPGRGRPGWHLECSAMSEKHLGRTFDIHGGGQDLIFPHHENEIAQSRCSHGTDIMAQVWMHNGYLMAEGEKMSKSLGNFYTVHDLLDESPGEAVRYVLLESHYRQPMDFRKDKISEAKGILDSWYRIVDTISAENVEVPDEIIEALSDDLNTPKAIAELHKLAALGKAGSEADQLKAKQRFLAGANFIGLLGQSAESWFKGGAAKSGGLSDAEIDALITERVQARTDKDFATSDRIRDELLAMNIILEDSADGTTWRRG